MKKRRDATINAIAQTLHIPYFASYPKRDMVDKIVAEIIRLQRETSQQKDRIRTLVRMEDLSTIQHCEVLAHAFGENLDMNRPKLHFAELCKRVKEFRG